MPDAPPPHPNPGERIEILPPSREYAPEQVADVVVDFIKKYRAAKGLPPMQP